MRHGGKLVDLLAGLGDRVILDVIPERDEDGNSPWVIVRHGEHVLALCLMPMGDNYLCVDAHAFVNGEAGLTAVLAMDNGRRFTLGENTPGTSHRWPGAGLVALLVGEQKRKGGA